MLGTTEQLQQIAIFSRLDPNQLAQLQPHTNVRQYLRQEIIMHEGDDLPFFTFRCLEWSDSNQENSFNRQRNNSTNVAYRRTVRGSGFIWQWHCSGNGCCFTTVSNSYRLERRFTRDNSANAGTGAGNYSGVKLLCF